MKLRLFFTLLGVLLLNSGTTLANSSFSEYRLQLPDQYYMVLYVETSSQESIEAFIAEMESYTNKVIDVNYSHSTHEFTILFNSNLRNDTIYQILLRYFDDFRETDGNYPNHK